MLHLLLHVFVPLITAIIFYRRNYLTAFLIMMASMLIDVDHVLATPIYDPLRCSVGFHPLHTLLPIGLYLAMLCHQKTRLLGLGLCIHIALDALDCQINTGWWFYTAS